MKRRTTLILLLLVFAVCDSIVHAQSLFDGFNPNADDIVRVIVVQPDGRILIGGDFRMVNGVWRNHIARLNTDGTVDMAFNPNANAPVFAIGLQPDGMVLVGGAFTTIHGMPRSCIARVNADGVPDSFNPNPGGCPPGVICAVHSIAVQSDGVLVGGSFTTIRGETRNHIARLNRDRDGTLDTAFNPNPNGVVRVIVLQPNDEILVGGEFTMLSPGRAVVMRHHMARLTVGGAVDMTFDPNASNTVRAIAVQADGKVLVGGSFSGAGSIGGERRYFLARLNSNDGLADSFNPVPNSDVNSIAVQSDGKVLVGGEFSTLGEGADRVTRKRIARLDAVTALPDSFDPNPNPAPIYSIAVQSDDKVLVGGAFYNLGEGVRRVTRKHIARLEADGSIDDTLNVSILGARIFATAIQRDQKILIGGAFTSVLGVPRRNIARLNRDGTLDMSFDPQADGDVNSIAVQADGDVLVGGSFTTLGAERHNCLARLRNGTPDIAFNPNPNTRVTSIAVQSNGRILIGGDFTRLSSSDGIPVPANRIARLMPTGGLDSEFDLSANATVRAIVIDPNGNILIGGDFTMLSSRGMAVRRRRIARLMPNGTVDMPFDPNANQSVYAIAVQADAKILVGGAFHSTVREPSIGGRVCNFIARLDAGTGVCERGFNPSANGSVYSIAVQSDHKILVGGAFRSIGGLPRNRIARLIAPIGVADAFNPNANNDVYAVSVQSDGKVLVGGSFSNIGGYFTSFFVRLSNDLAALSNIEVTPTTVTWTRNGSAPQLTHATFEYSWDNGVSYLFLGDVTPPVTPRSSVYLLTGLRLPVGRNVLVRVRGYYGNGYQNGSGSTTEQVRNFFLPLPETTVNLIRNPSFEEPTCPTPCELRQGVMPLYWQPIPSDRTPDTYSNTDTFGIGPAQNEDFAGATARDGERWVGGGTAYTEAFGQVLSSPLIPGQQYTLTAFLRKAVKRGLDGSGSYQIELWAYVPSEPPVFFDPVGLEHFDSIVVAEWQSRTLTFTAPANAADHPILVFKPIADTEFDAYPGIDIVDLRVSSPMTATLRIGWRGLDLGR